MAVRGSQQEVVHVVRTLAGPCRAAGSLGRHHAVHSLVQDRVRMALPGALHLAPTAAWACRKRRGLCSEAYNFW